MKTLIVITLSLMEFIILSCEPIEEPKDTPEIPVVEYTDTIGLFIYQDCGMLPASNSEIHFSLEYESGDFMVYEDTTLFTDINGFVVYSYFLTVDLNAYFLLVMSTPDGGTWFLDGPQRADDTIYANSQFEIIMNDSIHAELHFLFDELHSASDTLWYQANNSGWAFIPGPFEAETVINVDLASDEYAHYLLPDLKWFVSWKFNDNFLYEFYPLTSCAGTLIYEFQID